MGNSKDLQKLQIRNRKGTRVKFKANRYLLPTVNIYSVVLQRGIKI